jgi:hypothetical protein
VLSVLLEQRSYMNYRRRLSRPAEGKVPDGYNPLGKLSLPERADGIERAAHENHKAVAEGDEGKKASHEQRLPSAVHHVFYEGFKRHR